MRVSGAWLTDPATQAVFAALDRAGHQILAVGGCVRNALMDRPVDDVDMASSATPQQVMAAADAAGLRVVPTGLAHGTVTVLSGGHGFEVTSFRTDVETDGRHARVAFGADLVSDAARRDFTMNALYAQPDGTVLDPLGGMDDLQSRRVRFVGDPATRIAEDALRILRFFRFYALYGDPDHGIDADGLAACAEGAEGLTKVSAERITQELRKLLGAADPAPAMASMAMAGVLARVLPGADQTALAILVHLEPQPLDWIARLACISDGQGLRLSKAQARDLSALRDAIGSTHTPAALGHLLGTRAVDAVVLRAALMQAPLPDAWAAQIARGQRARFPLDADDLMPALSGPALGGALKSARAHWLAQDLAPQRAELLRFLGVAEDGDRT